jgi:hypothetical protein
MMRKSPDQKTVESQLKRLNSVNRSEDIKRRSYHQIIKRVNEPKQSEPNFKIARIISPVVLSIVAVILLFFIGMSFLNDNDPNQAVEPDEEEDVQPEKDIVLADYQFDRSKIQLNDVVAGMELIDGEFAEPGDDKFLIKGIFKGEVQLKGTVHHHERDNTLNFSLDDSSLNLLPTPVESNKQEYFDIDNQDWLKDKLDSEPGDTFHVVMTIDQYELDVNGSEKLQIAKLDRHYTKIVEGLNAGGTYQNAKYSYSFTIPEEWYGNVEIEENKSTTTFYHMCKQDGKRQEYLRIMVANDEPTKGAAKSLATHNGNNYYYQMPLDIGYMNEECSSDYSERYHAAFDGKSPKDYFQILYLESLGIFNQDQIQEGDQVAGLTVSNVRKEPENRSTSYYIDFTGEFTVKGSIVFDQVGGSKYKFIVEENMESIPHTLPQHESGRVLFNIVNGDLLESVLGEQLENMEPDGELVIEGVFKNYSHQFVPETDVPHTAEFVGLSYGN